MSLTEEGLSRLKGELEAKLAGRRCVVVGVGNELRGDDAAGVRLAERLETALSCGQAPLVRHGLGEGASPVRVPIIHAGEVPETYAVRVADLKPDVVLLLDAAAMGLPAGSCRLVRAHDLPPVPGFTHRPSLEMFARFIELDCGAESYVLGIQPDLDHLDLGHEMSPQVVAALDALLPLLAELLSRVGP